MLLQMILTQMPKKKFFYKLTDVNSRKQFILMGNLHGRTGSSDDFPVVGKYE